MKQFVVKKPFKSRSGLGHSSLWQNDACAAGVWSTSLVFARGLDEVYVAWKMFRIGSELGFGRLDYF